MNARATLRRATAGMALLACLGAAPARRVTAGSPPAELTPEAIQSDLASRVPSTWSVSQPEDQIGVPNVTLGIPDNWRGSPLSAAMALCPEADDPLWSAPALAGRTLRVVVRYHERNWPPYDCRS